MPIHVSVSTDTHEYRARMIIGCDGANSIVARASGLRTGSVQSDYAIDMMEETPRQELSTAERDRMYIYYRIRSHYGYGYVFPKASHLNVGVGFKLDYYLSNLRGEHYAHHQAFVDDLKSKQLLTGQSNRANFRAFPLPISGPLARTYADRVLLAGDAGGFVNALTAEGIYYAMVSGELAARAAHRRDRRPAISRARNCAGMKPAWKREIGDELAHSVRLQKLLLADPARIDRIVRAASRHAVLADLLARYATGASDARTIQTIDVAARVAGVRARENAEAASWLELAQNTVDVGRRLARCWWIRCSPSNASSANIRALSTTIFLSLQDAQEKTEFAFARLMYPPAPTAMFDRAGPRWAEGMSSWTQDYPRADRHFLLALRRLTRIHARSVEQPVNLDDGDDVYNWPWLYAVRPGEWLLTDAQAHKLRDYLLRGGFFMADDFWGTPEWAVFWDSMGRVFPGPAGG